MRGLQVLCLTLVLVGFIQGASLRKKRFIDLGSWLEKSNGWWEDTVDDFQEDIGTLQETSQERFDRLKIELERLRLLLEVQSGERLEETKIRIAEIGEELKEMLADGLVQLTAQLDTFGKKVNSHLENYVPLENFDVLCLFRDCEEATTTEEAPTTANE